MRIVLDHHYPQAVAAGLRERGLQAQAAVELDWHALTDEAMLDACRQVKALLVTNNVADFVTIARQWHLQGRSHTGLLLTSDARWPRTRAASGSLAQAIFEAFETTSTSGDWVDRIAWLISPASPAGGS